jgi:hypothetical protein
MNKAYSNYLMIMGGLLALTACNNDPKTFVPTNTEKFTFYEQDYYQQAQNVLQGDYLIVPDMSYSMNTSKSTLLNALDQFASDLADENIDYRVGFVQGTVQSNGFAQQYVPSTFLGSILDTSANSVLRDEVAGKLADLAKPNAPNWPFLLEAAKKTLDANKSTFLRSAAQLIYVFISDQDDMGNSQISGRTNSFYAQALKGFKSNAAYVSARAFVYTGSGGCVASGNGKATGTNLMAVSSSINAAGASSVCLTNASSMAASLENVARNVTRPTTRFKLQALPVAGSIAVRIGGAYTPQNSGSYPWSYSSASNEIIFSGNPVPAGATLAIEYDMVVKLARSPRVDTMVVTLNGGIVPQGANGWQYNASTRELVLGGGFAPQHGDTILVNYQVQ